MKKVVLLFAILSLVLTFSFALAAPIRVQLDGGYLNFTDENGAVVEPQLINNRTMVPLRKIFEALNCTINWDNATRSVTAVSGTKEIRLTIDNPVASVTDLNTKAVKTITLDSVPVIVNDRTLVPVRFIAESLEKEVGWDQENQTVIIIDYDKLTETFKQKAPALQTLFDFKLDDAKSFKSTSTIKGTLKSKGQTSETVNMNGNATLAVNGQDVEVKIKLDFTGAGGDIIKALKEEGLDHLDCHIVLKNGKLYMGLYDGTKYVYQDVTSQTSIDYVSEYSSNVDSIVVNNYEDVIALLKGNMTNMNSNTYATLVSAFEGIGLMLTKDNVKISTSGNSSTLSVTLDFGKLVSQLAGTGANALGDSFKLVIGANITKTNNVLSADVTKIDFAFTMPSTSETVEMNAEFSSTYTDVNVPVTINAPSL